MKLLLNIFLLALILFVSGCSTKKLTIKSLHPSKIEKDKINIISLQKFDRDDVNQTAALANEIANKTVDNRKIFTLKDNNFGVDAILTGDVLNSSLNIYPYYQTQTDYSRCRYYRYDEKRNSRHCIEYRIIDIPCEKRQYNVTTSVTLIKPSTNSVIFSKIYDKSSSEDICFDRPYHAYPDKFRVNSQIAQNIAQDILDDISPHYVYYDIEIIEELNKDNPIYTKEQKVRFENISKLIITKNLDLAKIELEKLDNEFSGKSFEVIYNLALIYEAFNQLQAANELYNEAKYLTLDVKYLDLINFGINRTSRNLQEKIKAKSQLP